MTQVELQIFVEHGCSQCDRALALAQEVDRDYAPLAVRVVDVSEGGPARDDVFAVPTFVLEDKVVSLGNPEGRDLQRAIEAALGRRGLV